MHFGTIPPVNFSFNPVDILETPPPAEEIRAGKQRINFPMTVPEMAFICIAKENLSRGLQPNQQIFAFEVTADDKERFAELNGRLNIYNETELSLEGIISTLWGKVGTFVQSQLLYTNNLQALQHERGLSLMAKYTMFVLLAKGCFAQVFTNREGQLLLALANQVQNFILNPPSNGNF